MDRMPGNHCEGPMGKQSRIKRERKARREQERPQVKAWAQVPAEAESGPCRKPDCTLAHCLDPWVSHVKLTNKAYEGPLVMVCYSRFPADDVPHQFYLRINGEEVAAVPTAELARRDPEAYHRAVTSLLEAVGKLYGAGASVAAIQHLAQSPQSHERQQKDAGRGSDDRN